MIVQEPEPLITTIIPTFRRPKLLRRAIRSVLDQTYPHFRVCIYDNASDDDTPSVVEEFSKSDARVRYHRRSENIGAGRNFVDAAGRIDTPFFSFLSDDDVLLPDFYKTALGGFDGFPEAMISATATIHISRRGEVLNVPILNWRPGLYVPPDGMLSMVKSGHPEWTSVLFRRELLQEIGPPDIEVGGPMDLDFELRAAARFPMVVSRQPGALFVIHKNSAGISQSVEALCAGFHKITSKILGDETIPLQVRSQVAYWLDMNFKTSLPRAGLWAIATGNWPKPNQTSRHLSDGCQFNAEPFTLKLLSEACQRFSLFRYVLLGLIAPCRFLHRSLRVLKARLLPTRLQKQFGGYSRHLEL